MLIAARIRDSAIGTPIAAALPYMAALTTTLNCKCIILFANPNGRLRNEYTSIFDEYSRKVLNNPAIPSVTVFREPVSRYPRRCIQETIFLIYIVRNAYMLTD